MKQFLFALALTALFTPSLVVQAQVPCGNIIAPADWEAGYVEPDAVFVTNPITDCANPFGILKSTVSPSGLEILGSTVANNSTVLIDTEVIKEYEIVYEVSNPDVYHLPALFRHDGEDYQYISLSPVTPTEEEYREMAGILFSNQADIDTNVARIMTTDPWDGLEFGTPEYEAVDTFYDYVAANFNSNPYLALGTYTLVFKELSNSGGVGLFQKLSKYLARVFVPTVYAQTPEEPSTYTITFTIANPTPEPTGASSVLFLPGIMGSRLYEESNACENEVDEQERWLSRDDCDQLRLLTDFTGTSINDIYTKAGTDSAIDESYGFNLYKTFFRALKDWKEDEIIADYAVVPYDWRLRLDDLLKARLNISTGKIEYDVSSSIQDSHLYKTLEDLATNPAKDKVTIVAHSNGGLLAKAFLSTLQNTNDPLLAKIDILIMVGSPQLGTPSTLIGMLHGDVIGPSGFVVSQQTTRTLMNTMPFGFHLLPNTSYFNGGGVTIDTPVVTFESGEVTTSWANIFGNTVTDADTLHTFLSTDSGRIKPAIDDLANPEVVDNYLFDYTSNIDQLMNSWVPPATMNVYEVAGIGIPTVSGVTYFTDQECINRDILKLFRCTEYQSKLGMRPNETIDGDATVVTPSALGMSESYPNVERWWLNLDAYNTAGIGGSTNLNRVHKDIFEVEDVINFVQNTIQATTSLPYQYLTNTAPNLPVENRLAFDLHSPLDLQVIDSDGNIIGSSTQTIEGALYNRYGELQHISVPNTGETFIVKLLGTALGSFTLDISEQEENTVIERHTYSAIPSDVGTKVVMEINRATPIEQSVLVVDYDGNGSSDISYDTEGEIVPEITYTTLFDALNALSLKPLYKKLLLENAKVAKLYYEKSLINSKYNQKELFSLNVLKQQVFLYERLRALTVTQKQELFEIINGLINK